MKQMTDPLRRINRAKKHLNIFNREMRAFFESNPYRCPINVDPHDGGYIFRPYLVKPLPINWGLLVGEWAHGLRSALDNMAWSLAITQDKLTSLPVYINRSSKFEGILKRLRSDVRADIEAVQPYNKTDKDRRSHPLWLLCGIDNIDKHRVILPALNKVYVATGMPSPNNWFFVDGMVRLNKGSKNFKVKPLLNLKHNFKPEIKVEVVFDIGLPPIERGDVSRIRLQGLFLIHEFVRNDVYPRFAEFLKPEDSLS